MGTATGLAEVVLSNEHLRVVLLPELGGRVWEITHLASGRQLLWHHPDLPPAPVALGAVYDDSFIGGWDELFPNDEPETLAGTAFPDHGEAWSVPWRWTVLEAGAAVRLELVAPLSGSRLVRTFRLAPGSAALDLEVELTNGTGRELPMLHKQHLAADLRPGSRIDLPAARVEIGGFGTPRAGGYDDVFDWPLLDTADGPADFAATPPDGTAELLFADRLDAGWVACTGPDGVGIGLCYDTDAYPACWIFASWAGWQDLRVAVLEPCTGVGLSVAAGVAAGRHRVLAPGETFRARLSAVAYAGLAEVRGISGHGSACRVEGVAR
ncbi:MAG: hypothetical protein LCH96_10060 [Actinobacteria bacterium]|nr:hypothetical protein [Actinomycetota bacterium]